MAVKGKGGLGRGLQDLFSMVEISSGDTEEVVAGSEAGSDVSKAPAAEEEGKTGKKEEPPAGGVVYIDINEIKPNENQPRKAFDEEKIGELAESILSLGMIQPIVLRKAELGYEIVAGERRWRAARRAELKEVPCIVKDLTEEENMIISIVENMQREDLNPVEEAEALQQMIDRFGFSQEDVAKTVGKSRPYITNSLRLLSLPAEVRALILEGKLSSGHAKVIAGVKEAEAQVLLGKKVAESGMSIKELEKYIKALSAVKKSGQAAKRRKSADVAKLEEDLKEILGTKVNLKASGNKGKIEIEYYNRDDLERLIELLKTLN